jgi:hypothetical protein
MPTSSNYTCHVGLSTSSKTEWSTPLLDDDDDEKRRILKLLGKPPIPTRYSLLSRYVSKELAKKAATSSFEKRKALISELKGDRAASAYRGTPL